MAEDAGSEIAKNIARNIVPLETGAAIGGAVDSAQAQLQRLLSSLGLLPGVGRAGPGPNDPLPRVDPSTGNIIWPGEAMQVAPGDVAARRRQIQLNQMYNR